MRSNRHFVPSLLALLCVPGRFAPSQAKITPRDADVGSLGSRLTTAEGAISTAQSTLTSLGGDVTTIQGDLTTVDGRLDSVEGTADAVAASIQGTGFQMDYGPTDKTGTGLAVEQNLTIPGPITLTDGHSYTINGTIKASKPVADGGALLYSAEIKGLQLVRDSGAWVTTPRAKGNRSLTEDAHADIASYFAVEADRPVFGVTSSNVTLAWKAIDTMHFTLELDGDIADDGVYTP